MDRPQYTPHVAANRAGPAPIIAWPGGNRAAMFLSFDLDAETAWTSKDPGHAERLVTMSYGGYEARVGVPKLLELLADLNLKATFFITGWSIEAHRATCDAVQAAGHEIGHHGFYHFMPEPGDPRVIEELEQGMAALASMGVVPAGYRAPYGESTDVLRTWLAEHGFLYSSSWRDDVRPYRQVLPDGRPGVLELPVTASYDDWMFGLSNRFSPRSIFPREHVLSIWKDELDETREWGAMVTTVLHPQVSGRPMRFRLLRTFLEYTIACGDVWIATGEQIARHVAAHEHG